MRACVTYRLLRRQKQQRQRWPLTRCFHSFIFHSKRIADNTVMPIRSISSALSDVEIQLKIGAHSAMFQYNIE